MYVYLYKVENIFKTPRKKKTKIVAVSMYVYIKVSIICMISYM